MKIVFMGTPEFAVPSLKIVMKHYTVAAVVTQPDRPKGRGKKLAFSPIKEIALTEEIPVLQPQKAREPGFIEKLQTYEPDLIVVVAFGQILPKAILDMPKFGCINVHGSLLPHYRGAAPIQWSIIKGETTTGVTIQHMDVGIDTGDMILKREMPIEVDDTYGSLHDKMSVVGAEALKEAVDLILEGRAPRTAQDHEGATYASPLKKEMGHIQWNASSKDIRNLIRGLDPWPSAYTYYKGEMLKIWRAIPVQTDHGECGQVTDVQKDQGFTVRTGDGGLLITELQAQGGKRMAAKEYLRGHGVDKGVILT